MTGDISAHLKRSVKRLLIYEPSLDLLTLANEVLRVFQCFDTWERQFIYAPGKEDPRFSIRKALDQSADIFQNGISVMNHQYQIIYENEANEKYGGYSELSPDGKNSIAVEILSYFKMHREYQDIALKKEVFLYDGDILPHPCLCRNLFRNGMFFCRIILTECCRPFRDADWVLLEYLGKSLEYLAESTDLFPLDSPPFGQLLKEALDTGHMNRLASESELKMRQWNYHDLYFVICLYPSPGDLLIASLDYYCSVINHSVSGTYAFPYQNRIIAVVNASLLSSTEEYLDTMRIFIRENNFRIGISNYKDDFDYFPTLFRQAETALSIGLVEKPTEWIHWFSDYTLSYIFNLLTSASSLGDLYSPVYYRLERYDKEHHTDYIKTLEAYLSTGENAAQTAKDLYIQRSTMNYRLTRIREIGKFDFENPDEMLHLQLTFRLLAKKRH